VRHGDGIGLQMWLLAKSILPAEARSKREKLQQ
jgi:hypothetical protein